MAKKKIVPALEFSPAIVAGGKVLCKWYSCEKWNEQTKAEYSKVFNDIMENVRSTGSKSDPIESGAHALCIWHGVEKWVDENKPLYVRVFTEALQARNKLLTNKQKA